MYFKGDIDQWPLDQWADLWGDLWGDLLGEPSQARSFQERFMELEIFVFKTEELKMS